MWYQKKLLLSKRSPDAGNRRLKTGKLLAQKIMLLAISFLLLAGCTNWKAKYILAKQDLDKCQDSKTRTEWVIESEKIIPHSVVADTILFEDMGDRKPEAGERKAKSEERKTDSRELKAENWIRSFFINQDSIQVWISVSNSLQDNLLIQSVKIDSLIYPLKTKTIMRNVIKPIRDYNVWKVLTLGGISGIAFFMILAIGYWFIKRK